MADTPDEPHDDQDRAETFDETHTTPDGGRIAQPDQDPPVFDATRAEGDADDLTAEDDADFDPDAASEDDIDVLLEPDERSGEARSFAPLGHDADYVTTEAAQPADFESRDLADDDIAALGYDDAEPPEEEYHPARD